VVAWMSFSIREVNTMSTTNTYVPALTPIAGQLVFAELVEPGSPGDDRVDRALAGYLAGYSGTTLVGYRLDLHNG
jgi:hypothetical protein